MLAWIDEYANELHGQLNLPDPTVDPEFDDEGSCILDIVVALADPIIIKPSNTGAIPFKGERWELVGAEVWTATEAEIVTQHAGES